MACGCSMPASTSSTRRTCRAGSCWSTATASASSTSRRSYGILDSQAREQGDVVYAIFDRATLDAATAAGVARYKHSIPGSTKRQSPHWNLDIVRADGGRGSDDVGADDLRAGDRARCAVDESRRNRRVVQRRRRAGHRPRLPQGRQVPGAGRHGAVLRCRAASGDRGVDGLRPAHRPLRQRAQQRRSDGIPGLYAAGECTGGVVGQQYVGSGNNYANCLVFGRVAGASAAASVVGS